MRRAWFLGLGVALAGVLFSASGARADERYDRGDRYRRSEVVERRQYYDRGDRDRDRDFRSRSSFDLSIGFGSRDCDDDYFHTSYTYSRGDYYRRPFYRETRVYSAPPPVVIYSPPPVICYPAPRIYRYEPCYTPSDAYIYRESRYYYGR